MGKHRRRESVSAIPVARKIKPLFVTDAGNVRVLIDTGDKRELLDVPTDVAKEAVHDVLPMLCAHCARGFLRAAH